MLHRHNKAFSICTFLLVVIGLYAAKAQKVLPSDKLATKETIHLYNNLFQLQHKGIMIGHQDDLAYGVNWKYETGRSDIKDVAGDYPAIYGWELGGLENNASANLDGVPFDKMQQFIKDAYGRGAVITISWHLNNPLTGKSAWDPAPKGSVAAALPGGSKNDLYKSWLDKVAIFMQSLTTAKGNYIPVIFRPFHELNGNWFWWGGNNCTPEELKQLYQFTVHYLRDIKGLHHLLYAYNTDRFNSKAAYLEKYPGNEWVDIMGFDIYQRGPTAAFAQELDTTLGLLDAIAAENNKIPALTEFGYNQLPDSTWWTDVFYKAIAPHNLVYALAWRNAGIKSKDDIEFYVPYTGQQSAADFKKFCDTKLILLEKEVKKLNLYK
ncbi:beta-mannosidase [Panacibacter sp. KCS-6]|uniref:Mannan endo-1,4-beta-mannosidase n=1 Tax=Limnovirga soli TaxID=2656915 RepID=A0A8J8JXM6_9BACT|nr:beta-mannosidase [Limnovirga soli]